jgi:hypothetical protein
MTSNRKNTSGLFSFQVFSPHVNEGFIDDWRNIAITLIEVRLDLLIAIGTGFLSAPGPLQRLAFDAPNVLVGRYPLVMIPLFAVPLSLLLHACSLAKLTHDNSAPAKSQVSYA